MSYEEYEEEPPINTASFFDKNGLFGSWPTQAQIESLIKWKVDIIVNLTSETETKVIPYIIDDSIRVIKYPIKDRSVPEDKISFYNLVLDICKNMDEGKKVYIHCRGGHGRSGILVAAILKFRRKITPAESIRYTKMYHSKRKIMRQKWRDIGSPQTLYQKKFILNFFADDITPKKFVLESCTKKNLLILRKKLWKLN